MTDRTAVIARITDKIQLLTGAEPDELVHDKPLHGQQRIDSLDVMEIGMAVEDEFTVDLSRLEIGDDTTIDTIADAVIAAQREGKL